MPKIFFKVGWLKPGTLFRTSTVVDRKYYRDIKPWALYGDTVPVEKENERLGNI